MPEGYARLDRGLSPATLDIAAFWTRFNDAQLDELVERAQLMLRGVEPQKLRDSTSLRQRLVATRVP